MTNQVQDEMRKQKLMSTTCQPCYSRIGHTYNPHDEPSIKQKNERTHAWNQLTSLSYQFSPHSVARGTSRGAKFTETVIFKGSERCPQNFDWHRFGVAGTGQNWASNGNSPNVTYKTIL